MEKSDLDNEVKMISAVSRALELRKVENDNEKIINQISNFSSQEKSEETKLRMIAAASKALDIAERNPRLKDKEIIKQVSRELSSISQEINKHKIEKSKN